MPNRLKPPLRRNRITSAIRLACSAGLLVSFALPASGVANETVRSSRNAFGIPYDYPGIPGDYADFAAYPTVTYIDGQGYLQYIEYTFDGDGRTYKNNIIGPFEALLDSTIPWEDLIYSSEEFNPPRSYFRDSSLVDLDNDGELEIYDVHENRLYTLTSSPEIIRENLIDISICSRNYGCTFEGTAFIDMDGDGDLDVFISTQMKGVGSFDRAVAYHENIGTAEVPQFDQEGVSPWESNKERLPPGLYEQTVHQAPYLISADIDKDGDLDLIRARYPSTINYFENMGPVQHPVFTNPYKPFPLDQLFVGRFQRLDLDTNTSWIQLTDFDTDGDIDLLTDLNGKLNFFEKLNGPPLRYKSPISIETQLSPTRWPDFGGFADLDGDGVQEILFIEEKELILQKLEDDSFEKILLHRGDELDSALENTLQFIDGDNDGDLDIAMKSGKRAWDQYENIIYFEQHAPLSFGPLTILPKDALDLKDTHFETYPKSADLDGDGDNDTLYRYGYVDWNHEREPGSIVNFSIRSHVGESANVQIGGFIIEGPSPQTVILRGLGPSLAGEGVSDPLNDPEIHLFSGQTRIGGNDDWRSAEGADKIESAGIAPTDPREAALRVRLNPGAYTVHLRGKAGDTGVGIINIEPDIQMPTTSLQISISGRTLVEDGENVTIGGFIIEGDTPVKALIRGLGPSLWEKGVDSPLADPTITLFSGSRVIAFNNDWKQNSNASEIAQMSIAPTHDTEAAILTELQPGPYTVHLRDAKGESGIGIVAIDRP